MDMGKIKLLLGVSILLLMSVQARAAFVSYDINFTPDDPQFGAFAGTIDVDMQLIPLGSCGGCNHQGLTNLDLIFDGVDLSTNIIPFVTFSFGRVDIRYLDGFGGGLNHVLGVQLGLFTSNITGNDFNPLNPPLFNYQWLCVDPLSGCTNDSTGSYTLTGEGVPYPTSVVPVPAAVWLFGTALIGLVGFNKRRKAA